MRVPAHPGLYEPDSDAPVLNGSRCTSCGQVSFPPISIGCDVCGAPDDQLESAQLNPHGLVHSIVAVHLHRGAPAARFAVAEIQLDAGPLIRATVSEEAPDLAIGDRVSAAWVVTSVNSEGAETVEPRFTREMA